jgi:hypothetical protein
MFFHKKDRSGCGEAVCAKTWDFANIFLRDMGSLFHLGLLLTANPPDAERCFLEALDLCADGAMVHSQWAPAWARRSIIKSAIKIMAPIHADNRSCSDSGPEKEDRLEVESVLDEVCNLAIFDRFVFVMSILEKFPDRECSVLLNCIQREIVAARIRAMRHLAKFDETSLGWQHVRLDHTADGVFRARPEIDCVRRQPRATRGNFRPTSTEFESTWARVRS